MIRIAYIIDTIETPTAGTEKQLFMLLEGLDRSRFSPHLICLHDSEWLRRQDFSFPVVTMNTHSFFSPRSLSTVRQLTRYLRAEKPNIVQTFFFDSNVYGVIAARLARRRTVVAGRRSLGHGFGRRHLWTLRRLRRWTTQYLANSQAAARHTQRADRVPADRITVIYNGLDLDAYREISPRSRAEQRRQWRIGETETLVGVVSNLRTVKSIDSLIRAAAALAPRYPSVRYVVVGEGPDRTRLQRLIDRLGLSERFRLVGTGTDVIACLAAFDTAVMCSLKESFSNSLIEYMAARLPIVASDVGGNSEAIVHQTNGLLYRAGDHEALAECLRILVEDKPLAIRLADAARKDAFHRFSREVYIENHQDFYRRLVDQVK